MTYSFRVRLGSADKIVVLTTCHTCLSIVAEVDQPSHDAWHAKLEPTEERWADLPAAIANSKEHIIDLQPGHWVIQHPLKERLLGTLFDCPVTWPDEDTGVYGRFLLVWDEEADEWVLGDQVP